jgi:hypothetical protein
MKQLLNIRTQMIVATDARLIQSYDPAGKDVESIAPRQQSSLYSTSEKTTSFEDVLTYKGTIAQAD